MTLVWCPGGQETKRESHQSCRPLDDSNEFVCVLCKMSALLNDRLESGMWA